MPKKLSPFQKELRQLGKEEKKFLEKNIHSSDSALNKLISEKIPAKLQSSVEAAFSKAFALIFEKGSTFIEKTCSAAEREKRYKIAEYTAKIRDDRKSYKSFSKTAKAAGRTNTAISAAAGMGMGAFGVGIPDIPLFTSLMFKNIYEIALSYGYDYKSEQEQTFILMLIRGAVSHGEELEKINDQLDYFIENGSFSQEYNREELIKSAAASLSKELMYMKFIQGIPVVGLVGGVYDAVYMGRISKYASLKYKRRFYMDF